MKAPCPCCDLLERMAFSIEAFAYGVAIGSAFEDMHSITELMCDEHRAPYVLACARAAARANTTPEDEA